MMNAAPAFTVPWKHRPLTESELARQQLNSRLFTLASGSDCYVVWPFVRDGSSGKIHPALSLYGTGDRLAIKAMRLSKKKGKSARNAQKTGAMCMQEIGREFQAQLSAHNFFASHAANCCDVALFGGHDGMHRFFQPEQALFTPQLIYDWEHCNKFALQAPKAYIISSFRPGTAAQLALRLDAFCSAGEAMALRCTMARNFAYQIFSQLQHLHENGRFGHFDLSLANVLVGANGAFYLADFGRAQPLDGANVAKEAPGLWGSVLTPEALGWGEFGRAYAMGTKADILSLWVLTLQILAGLVHLSPFHCLQKNMETGRYQENPRHAHGAWHSFYAFVAQLPRNTCNQVVVPRVIAHQLQLPRSDHAGVDSMMQQAIACDPELVEIALRFGMRKSPADRSSAAQQARMVAPLLAAVSLCSVDALRAHAAALGQDGALDLAFAQLQRFRTLVAAKASLAQNRPMPLHAGPVATVDPQLLQPAAL